MAAISLFFHNGQCWYSISIDTWKTLDANFGRLVIWNFSIWSIFMKWWPFFWFCHNGQCWYSVSVDTQKSLDATFPLAQFLEFSIGSVFTITLCLKHLCIDIYALWPFCTSKKWQRCKFIGSVFGIFHWFSFAHHPMLLCLKIYAWTFICGDLSALL